MPNKRIRIFAGPNGSGKSSLFKEFCKNYNATGPFINADEIENTLITKSLIDLNDFGVKATKEDLEDFKKLTDSVTLINKANRENYSIDITISENCIVDIAKESHSYEASFTASFIRHLLIRESKSFSFETVMSHESKITEIANLKSSGYNPYLYFVCIDDPKINVSRVANRVEKGGHPVSENKITQRYSRTLANLHKILPLCYRAYLFDNSGKKLDLVAELYNNSIKLYTDSPPKWFIDYVLPYYTAK